MEFPFYYQEREQAERRYGRKFLLAHYYDFAKVSGVMAKLARDPALLEIARLYFGTEPVPIGMRAWWSFASPASPAALEGPARSSIMILTTTGRWRCFST